MLKDPERVITTMHRATNIAANTDDYAKKAIVKAYVDVVSILNDCTDEDCLSSVWTKLESIEENLTCGLAGM